MTTVTFVRSASTTTGFLRYFISIPSSAPIQWSHRSRTCRCSGASTKDEGKAVWRAGHSSWHPPLLQRCEGLARLRPGGRVLLVEEGHTRINACVGNRVHPCHV